MQQIISTKGNHSRLMSVKAAADYLGMSVYTIRDRIARGEIPAVRDGGRIVRLDIQDLDAWIEKRKERLL